jgi:hypothetical protein
MDPSISAWLRMKEFFPEKTGNILTMLVHRDRLRRAAEKEFPNARSFVRPGFDTGNHRSNRCRNLKQSVEFNRV